MSSKYLGRPHSHDHADSLDDAIESSREGLRAVWVGLAGLGATFLAQLAILAVSGSVALAADTVHNLADALTAVPLAIAFTLVRRPASRSHTYGYGRAEDLAGIIIVLVIAASAVWTGVEAVRRLLHPAPVDHLAWVAAAGLIGFLGNEAVAIYRIRVGRRIGSAALVADGLHARTDGLTSLGVLASAAGLGLGIPMADPIVALVICVLIVGVLTQAARHVYRRLMDAVDPTHTDTARATLMGTPGVLGIDDLRLRWVGHRLRLEAAITTDPQLTLIASHNIAEQARHALLHAVAHLADATIHVSPASDPDTHHTVLAHHFHHYSHGSPGCSQSGALASRRPGDSVREPVVDRWRVIVGASE